MVLSLVSHFRRQSNCPEAALEIVLSFLLELGSERNSIRTTDTLNEIH